jgi:hypothetical protein
MVLTTVGCQYNLITKEMIMKKIFLVFIVGVGLAACGDNSSDNNMNGTGGTIDSNVTPAPDNSTTTQPDTSMMDPHSGVQGSDTASLRSMNGGNSANGAGGGNSSGQTGSGESNHGAGTPQSGSGSTQGSGQSTNSTNSGSSTQDGQGSK